LDKDKFLSGMKSFRNRGVLEEIFDPKTLKRLESFDDYVSFLPKGMGAGEGIKKAEVASQIGGVFLPTPTAAAQAVRGATTLGRHRLIAWAFVTGKIRKFLIGADRMKKEGLNTNVLAAIGGALGVILGNISEISESGSFDISNEQILPESISGFFN